MEFYGLVFNYEVEKQKFSGEHFLDFCLKTTLQGYCLLLCLISVCSCLFVVVYLLGQWEMVIVLSPGGAS